MAVRIIPKDAVTLDNILSTYDWSLFNFPRIIHQVWINFSNDKNRDSIPKQYMKSHESWINLHVGWVYVLWDKKLSYDFVNTFFPSFYGTFCSLTYDIQRIDMIRYCFLYRYGGIYCDLDVVPVKKVDEYIKDFSNVYLVTSPTARGIYANSFMVSNKNVNIWMMLLKRIKNYRPWFENLSKHVAVMYTTGPIALTEIIESCTDSISRLPSRYFNAETPDEVGIVKGKLEQVLVNYQTRSWFAADSQIISWCYNNRKILILTSFILIVCLSYFSYKYISQRRKRRCDCNI